MHHLAQACLNAVTATPEGRAPEVGPEPFLKTCACADDRPVFLDIRPPQEGAEEGVIPQTTLCVPMQLLPDAFEDALADATRNDEPDKDQPIVCYCRSGRRSLTGVAILRSLGYANAVSLAGGIKQWAAAGGTLV